MISSREDGAFSPGIVLRERYEILSKIGEGGFGEVYKARQLATGQLVALKKRRSPGNEGESRDRRTARFLREARLCALLHHPNIVQLLDAGTAEDGELFTVFAFVPGENLAEVLATEGALPPPEARHLMLQVLDALACAHGQGVVHRDLKPSNIMVVRTGARRNAVVLDFGVGVLVSNQSPPEPPRLTGSREILGTLGYGAPELCRGGEVSSSADLFSWGLVFVECLTGRPVYGNVSAAEVIYHLLGPDPVPMPPALAAHPLGQLLGRAMSKEVARRDLSAQQLLQALEACDVSRLSRFVADPLRTGVDASRSTEPHPGNGPSPHEEGTANATQASPIKERRHVTALCCRIAARSLKPVPLDIEQSDDLVRGTLLDGVDIIRQHAGHVAGALGDQLLAYFGIPPAMEGATQRAGHAATAIVAAVREANSRLSLQGVSLDVGLGIHTGLLVVAEAELRPNGQSAVGETPRMAARLASLASPGSVVVTAEVERQLRRDFELESLGGSSDGGPAIESQVFRLGRYRGRSTASGSREAEAQARLVGRDHELDMLWERWRRTVAGTGQCSLITGEPGIGKSRLTRELAARLAAGEHTYLEGRCVPDAQHDVLFPFVQMVENVLGVDHKETPDWATTRLETALARYGLDLTETMPLMLEICSLPVRPPYTLPDVSPQRRMEMVQRIMLALFFAMAEKQPLLLLIEDLHWASPTAIGFLTRLVQEAPEYPICMVMTARPEFSPSFSTAGVLQLPLARLDNDETRALAMDVAGAKGLPSGMLDAVVRRTDGIPLFIEELTRLIVETGVSSKREGDSDALPDAFMPDSLRALLSARLDRLERAKATAAIAAALGRDFSVEVLTAVSTLGAEAVEQDLAKLARAGLIMRRDRRKDATATFKHALVRDAAYDSLPRAEKQKVHGRIAEVLEERFLDISRSRPEVVALHFAAADRMAEAIPYAQKAAEQALNRCAYNEAIAIASKELEWTSALPPDDAVSVRLAANDVLTQALMPSRGWVDPEIRRIAEESSGLLQKLPSSNPKKFSMLWSLFCYYHTASDRPAARTVAEESVLLADELAEPGLQAAAAILIASTLHAEGELGRAGEALEKAMALYQPENHRDHGRRLGLDTLVCAKSILAHVRWFQIQDATAFRLVNEATTWAREIGHVPSLAYALLYGCQIHQLVGDKAAVAASTEELLQLAAKHGLPAYEAYGSIVHAWATGDDQKIDQLLSMLGALGCNLGLSYYASLSADVLADRGELDAAVAVVDRCISHCEGHGEHYYEHFLHWRRAMYCRKKGSAVGEVRASLDRAWTVARRYGARRVELLARENQVSVDEAKGAG
jgi:TOMM system kinase/cyclase fusion protein